MIYKIIFLMLLVFSSVKAGMQEIRIGTIDKFYANEINKDELKGILDDIQETFKTQLGYDVFKYSAVGKPIDILYVAPLKLEKRIALKTKKLQIKKNKIDDLQMEFPDKQKRIEEYKENLTKFADHIHQMTKSLNSYIKNANKRRDFTTAEYKNVQMFVSRKQNRIDREIVNLRKERRILRRLIDDYNKKIYKLNRLVYEYNNLTNQIRKMSTNIVKVKGKTFGLQEVSLKTYYKDGKKVKEKSVKNSMTKIEIYGFENKQQLKAVLAHEIAHLVGLPHINVEGALMNPILQSNQIENLALTKEDIRNFNENF